MSKNRKNNKTRIPTVEETNAELAREFGEQDSEAKDSLPKKSDSDASNESMQSSSVLADKAAEIIPDVSAFGSDQRPLREPTGMLFPADSHETDQNAKKFLTKFARDSEKRNQNPSLLLNDLKELRMYGELSEDQKHITMPFEDAQRLVTTMRMTEVILNERIQNKRKAKLEVLKAQLNASECKNMPALLVELERLQSALRQKYSFQQVGMFGDEPVIDLEGIIHFETLLLARAVDWLATLSIDPDLETRRGTLSVFSELKAAYSTQSSLHELYFHQYDDKKVLEQRVRGAMSDMGERLKKVSAAPSSSATAKRHNIDVELQGVSSLVEEMLTIAKQSYSASLTASHMGHLAFELNITIAQLRRRIDELQREVRSWILRSSQDSTAAMILAEENIVLAKANSELAEKIQQLNGRQRKQTEVLSGLLATTDFGLSSTVLQEAVPKSQTLFELLDLPGIYSRLIGDLREPIANNKGVLSILAPTTFTTRNDLVESIEQQLRRSIDPDLQVANAYMTVAQARALEAERRGLAAYGDKRIPKRGVESIFHCEPSWLRKELPSHLKAPIPIAHEQVTGLLDDLQNRGSIVHVDRFFDAKGNQIQDVQVARDPLPATVLMVNAMNTSAELSDLLRRGDIPRLLNQELKERMPAKNPFDFQPQSFSSGSIQIEKRARPDFKPDTTDLNVSSSNDSAPAGGTNRGEKRKETRDDIPSPSLTLAVGLGPMPNAEVLHPFAQQNEVWDHLWIGGASAHFTVNAKRLMNKEDNEADKDAVKDVCTFFMNMKRDTGMFQHRVDWKNPSSRIKTVLDKISRETPAFVDSAPTKKQNKQQRRSLAGIGRDLPDSLPGLAVEWNVEAERSWAWNDNQVGAAYNDPELLTRLLQHSRYLPDKFDYLAEGKKVLLAEVMAISYKKFLARNDPPSTPADNKSGKGKGKGKFGTMRGNQRPKWPPPKPEVTGYDLLMLPHPDTVNHEEGTYVIQGPLTYKTRVTNENWATLRFNTKTMGPEYFPSSYLSPVPTVSDPEGKTGTATFPRSTITGTLEELRNLLLVPLLSKNNKVPIHVYRALSLNIASEATHSTDKATAPKRVKTFLQLCAMYIPCEHDEYDDAVYNLDAEVDHDLFKAKLTLEVVQEQQLPAIIKAQNEAVSTLLQVLYFLQQGHVQFLVGDYRARVIDAHGHDAFTAKVRTKKPGKDGLPRSIHDVGNVSTPPPDGTVDMTHEDEEGAVGTDDEGSESHLNCDSEGEQANTHVPSTARQEMRKRSMRASVPLQISEAAGFSSDTSPRNETGDNDELSRAERK